MPKIQIVRTDAPKPTEAELELFRKIVFGLLAGFTPDDRKMWNRFWNQAMKMEAGELFTVDTKFIRNYKFHNKLFALLTVGFEAWEPNRKRYTYKGKPIAKHFERFREEVIILSGHYDQVFGLDGKMKLVAHSISFAAMDDGEFEKFYSDVADVLLKMVLVNYKDRAELDAVVERIMNFNT